MSGTFRAVVFPAANRAELRELPLRDPGPGEVEARITVSGVSIGTEYLVLSGQFPNQKFPCLVGYQSVGIVERVGEGVTALKAGDRIFVGSVAPPEGYHEGAGVAHVSRAIIPAAPGGTLHPGPIVIPPHVSDDAAAYIVLVGVALEGEQMAKVGRGDLVAVVGQGIVGQLVAQVCKSRGAIVYVSDLDPKRVELAAELGADRAFALDVPAFDKEIRAVQSKGADIVFDTTGNTKVLEQALLLARNYGTFVVQGHYPGSLVFRFVHAHWRHLTMVFPCGGANRWDAMHALDRGQVRVDPLIRQRVRPEGAPALYGKIAARSSEILGATIRWSD